MFDFSSGKILIYINKSVNELENDEPSEHIFSWDLDTLNRYKIKGTYSFTDKDTLLFWTYNAEKEIMIDEKGLVYSRKKLNR